MTKIIKTLAAATAMAAIFTLSTGCESSGGGNGKDEVSYSKLEARYGAPVDMEGRKHEGVTIKNLRVGANSWSFEYEDGANLTAWGYPLEGPGSLQPASMFMKTKDGKWIGGMMHYQGSNKTYSDFHNVYHPGYIGFVDVFNHIPNPCEIAFVILDGKSKRRSNVIKTTWTWNESRRQ